MSAPTVKLAIVGDPMTQGSKSAVVGRDGRARVIEGRGSKGRARFKNWRQAVTAQARAQYVGEPMDGPLAVELHFRLPLPKSAPKRRRIWPYRGLDVDKLTRAVFDGLTDAGVWADDRRVCDQHSTKRYAYDAEPGCTVRIWQLDDADA